MANYVFVGFYKINISRCGFPLFLSVGIIRSIDLQSNVKSQKWKRWHDAVCLAEQRKRRSPNWGEQETLVLLQLWGERVQEMKTTKRNGFMLDEMAQMLRERGYSRSSTEVKTRIANLSQEYR